MSYQRINTLAGWAVFAIAFIVYLLTVSPTASFWDCGEFIACANELEVTHPPGAPLFMLLGRIMAMLAFDPSNVAFMINLLSVTAGAFTVLFTFWTTTILAKKGLDIFEWEDELKTVAIIGSGIVAGLTCTFADSIWFNAVEAEVYSMSGFFTALVVWLMFKWDARADQPGHLKWIILIAYIMGLSTGVHLLNLLTIPALALVYYVRKYDFTWKGFAATMGISVAALAVIQYGILQYSVKLARWFELMFTGTQNRAGEVTGGMGMAPGTGAMVLVLLIVTALVAMIWWSHQKQKVILNTVFLALTAILIGASSYATIYIRSNANPAIDMNNPENVFTFLSYMKREQYGDRPLAYGPMYHSQIKRDANGTVERSSEGMKYFVMDEGARYVEDMEEFSYEYDKEFLFPRMYESSRYNAGPYGYINYVSDKGENPDSPMDDNPSRLEDLSYFLDYQIGHMYLRYFLWNFVGRESDIQDDRWESGLELYDGSRYTSNRRNNKGKNHYFFLPLFLGLLGIVWQLIARKQDAGIIGLLFFFTGIAIVLYLNQYPGQPRERDYSYAGSFQTFSIWVGLGVLFLTDILKRFFNRKAAIVATIIALMAPMLMAIQNWDDHTRSGRWIDIEFAKNLLDTCAPNAILFTGGDNDTFPLWYIQEVEGYRTDVRVVNLELLISDWYIDQMKQPKNDSEALPISMKREDYLGDKSMIIRNYGNKVITLPVDRGACLDYGVLNKNEAQQIGENMVWNFRARQGGYILRKDSVIIDIMRNVAADGWKRPVYFGNTMPQENYASLMPYFRNEGLAYRVVPVKKSERTINDEYYGTIDPEIMERNLTEKFSYTGLDDPSVNFDEHIRNVIISNYRNAFFRLASAYAGEYAWRDSLQTYLTQQSLVEGAPVDSLTQRITTLKSEKTDLKAKAVNSILESGTRIPNWVIPQDNIYLLLRQASVLELVQAEEVKEIYELLVNQSITQMKDYQAIGQEINQHSLPLQGAFYSLQYYLETGDEESFGKYGDAVDEILGQPVSQSFRQQFDSE